VSDAPAAPAASAPIAADVPERELESQIDSVLASEVMSGAEPANTAVDETASDAVPAADAEDVAANETATEALDVIEDESPAPSPVPEATLGATGETLAADDDFDQLWGATVHSRPSCAAGAHRGSRSGSARRRPRRRHHLGRRAARDATAAAARE
jgi:hypothetical protein